jgi:hypothetical protein
MFERNLQLGKTPSASASWFLIAMLRDNTQQAPCTVPHPVKDPLTVLVQYVTPPYWRLKTHQFQLIDYTENVTVCRHVVSLVLITN